jgi:hypothetical protein
MTCHVFLSFCERFSVYEWSAAHGTDIIRLPRRFVCEGGVSQPSMTLEWDDNYHETDRCEFKTWWHAPSCASGVKYVPTCKVPEATCSKAA